MDLILNLLPIFIVVYYIIICVVLVPKIFKNANLNKNNKFLWMLIVICLPFLGTIAYVIFNKK